jgi:FkbM family methyltransferase
MSISPISAFRRLQGLGLFGCLYYADLLRACPQVVPEPFFVSEAKADIAAHEGHWISLYDRLCDQRSKVILSDLLGYRLSGDPRCMADYSVRVSDQYFESFLRLNNEVFVDAGGFDGDTAAQFCRRFADYRRVILFEPSARNMLAAKARLAGVRDVEFVEKGLSNDSGSLRFDPDAGAASAVVSVGSCSIDVTTLDASIGQEVSFIKMDLEGWELKALEGSRNHIRADHPKLAIAVYHAAADFWLIPEYIANLREDYDLYLRHYTEGWSETVMFFVPRNSA